MSLVTLLKRRPAATDLATGTPTGALFLRDDMSWAAPAGGGGGSGSTLLAFVDYEPTGAGATYTRSASTLAAVDTTNLRATFTAPTSGIVVVRFTGTGNAAATTGFIVGLLNGASAIKSNQAFYNNGGSQSPSMPISIAWRVTGLTSGTSYSFDLGFASTNASAINMYAGGGTAAETGAANKCQIEVWSA